MQQAFLFWYQFPSCRGRAFILHSNQRFNQGGCSILMKLRPWYGGGPCFPSLTERPGGDGGIWAPKMSEEMSSRWAVLSCAGTYFRANLSTRAWKRAWHPSAEHGWVFRNFVNTYLISAAITSCIWLHKQLWGRATLAKIMPHFLHIRKHSVL